MADKIDPYFLDYRDRGMAKWMTAFSIGELTSAIEKSKAEHRKDIERLPQQHFEYIERCLERSIKYNKVLEIQLNSRDHLGRVKDHIIGNFRGFNEHDEIVINSIDGNKQLDKYIDFSDIRHIIVHNFTKWSDQSTPPYEEMEILPEIEEFCDYYFNDGEFSE